MHFVPARLQRGLHQQVTDRLIVVAGGPARLRVIVILACVLALDSADSATVGAVATPLERALHIGNTRLGLLITVSTAVGALATLPIGMLVDRVNRVRLLTGAVVLWSVASAISGFSSSYLMLLLTRLALGSLVAAAGPAIASLTGDFFPPGQRGRIYGYILSGELLGAGAGLLIAGDVAGFATWRASFIVLAVPGLALAWAIHTLLPEPIRGGQSQLEEGATEIEPAADAEPVPGTEPAAGAEPAPDAARPPGADDQQDPAAAEQDPALAAVDSTMRREVSRAGVEPDPALVLHQDPDRMKLRDAVRYVLALRTNRLLIVSSALGYFFFTGLKAFAVEFMRGRFGLSQTTATLLIGVLGVGALLGVLSGGRLADRLIPRGHPAARPLVAGAAFLIAAGLFLPSLLLTSLVFAAPLIFLAAVAYGATNPPLDAARLDIIHHRLWGRAEAVRTFLRSLFEAAAPLAFGIVSSQFGGRGGFGSAAHSSTGSTKATAAGLDPTFLIMLIPLVIAGALLARYARRTYPRDVATAIASERETAAGRRPPGQQDEPATADQTH